VDPEKIGMTGHSYGGHSTIFTAAFEPRIKVAVANGPVSDFLHHGMHWAVPMGASNSQSLPKMRPYVLDHTLPICRHEHSEAFTHVAPRVFPPMRGPVVLAAIDRSSPELSDCVHIHDVLLWAVSRAELAKLQAHKRW